MARESKVMQVYPSDQKVQAAMDINSIFGWEVTGNQKFQEYTGQTRDGNTTTKHFSTYVKLTFSREKSAPWYSRVVSLEKEWYDIDVRMYALWKEKPTKKILRMVLIFFAMWILSTILGVGIVKQFIKMPKRGTQAYNTYLETALGVCVVPGVLLTIAIFYIWGKKVKEFNDKHADERIALRNRRAEIEAECNRLING
ncbi:MAG: hypothetical protein IKX10_06440 [Lachnospiraceae bacterium]|nr:hypothetical protein [Lachnospiraceae bacterium]